MSWHFSQALVAEFSALCCLGTASCALLKSTRTAERSSYDGKKKATSRHSPFGMMLNPSKANLGVELWILSLQASRASRSPLQDCSTEPTTHEICGRTQYVLSGKWDHATHSWRMSRDLQPTSTSKKSLAICRTQGLVQNGKLFLPLNSGHRTCVRGSRYLPTPTARDWRISKRPPPSRNSACLNDIVGGPLNPEYVEWLMAWPIGWTKLEPLETIKFQSWQQLHGVDL